MAILSLEGPPRDPKIALHYHFRRRISHSDTCTILILYLTDYKYGIRQMFLTENSESADLDQSINQSIYLCQYVGWRCPQRLMNETYDNIIPIEYVNYFNFVCFYFEYLVLLLTLLSLLRIELWLWLSFLGKGKF